ncbi:MAG: VCBS repeat-containing protein [Planctomycetota bacterium]
MTLSLAFPLLLSLSNQVPIDVYPTSPSALQSAIDAAAPGSTLLVHGGTYSRISVDKPLSIICNPHAVVDGCPDPYSYSSCGESAIALTGPGSGVVRLEGLITSTYLNGVIGAIGPFPRLVAGGFDELWLMNCDFGWGQWSSNLTGQASGADAVSAQIPLVVVGYCSLTPIESGTDERFPPPSPSGLSASGTVVAFGSYFSGGNGDQLYIDCSGPLGEPLPDEGLGGSAVAAYSLFDMNCSLLPGSGSPWHCTDGTPQSGTQPDGMPFIGGTRLTIDLPATDCDGDGIPDALAVAAGLASLDDPHFDHRINVSAACIGAKATCLVDVDGDDDVDVIAVSYGDGKVRIFANDGSGGLANATELAAGLQGPWSIEPGDLDGDSDPDLVVSLFDAGEVVWFENDAGTFSGVPSIVGTIPQPSAATIGDVDNDGILDVVAASYQAGAVYWFRQLPTGGFSNQQLVGNGIGGAYDCKLLDVDSDGDLDVVSAALLADTVKWHENDGSGVFGGAHVIGQQVDGARSLATGDLDGDGAIDVVCASSFDDSISWFSGDGLGGFGPRHTITSGVDGAQHVGVEDLNADGAPDIIVASANGDYAGWIPSLGGGSFDELVVVGSGSAYARDVDSADLDGDGNLDLVVTSRDDNTIAWYPQRVLHDCNSNGWPDCVDILSGASTDFDGNGVPDECLQPLLAADTVTLSLSMGGAQHLQLTGGAAGALQFFFLLGSATGSSPGIHDSVSGATLPLNYDAYFELLLLSGGAGILVPQYGFLDQYGNATSKVLVPPSTNPTLAGLGLTHAYLTVNVLTDWTLGFVSNPVPLTLVP